MSEGVHNKTVICITVERRLEVDGNDIMQKVIISDIIPLEQVETVLDKIREMLKVSEQNTFSFLQKDRIYEKL